MTKPAIWHHFFEINEVNIQLMHSQDLSTLESDVHQGNPPRQSRGGHHFRGLTNPDVNRKRMHQLFCYMTLPPFSNTSSYQAVLYFAQRFLKVKTRFFNNCLFQVDVQKNESFEITVLIQIIKFLISNISSVKYTQGIMLVYFYPSLE